MSETIKNTNKESNTNSNNNQDINQKQEKDNLPPNKDLMKEKMDEIKSMYEQMIKLRKQNLEGYKKIDTSK